MRSDEHRLVQKQLEDSDWDEGVIRDFTAQHDTLSVAVDLDEHATILFFGKAEDVAHELPAIANQTRQILSWLGVNGRRFVFLLFWRKDPRHCAVDEWPSRRNVNGGWTVPGSMEIVVYRSEEWDRVFLHETIHTMEWDWKMPTQPLPCWGLGEKAIVAPHLFEAWTELYAEWLWCGWHDVPWSTQRAHMDAQAVQILARVAGRDWNEDTNVFAYYVLKAALAPAFPFLWAFRNGDSPDERSAILCHLVTPRLAELRRMASRTTPTACSLRMTVTPKN